MSAVLKLPASGALQRAYAAKLRSSTLTVADGDKLQFRVYSAAQSKDLDLPHFVEGFTLPYFNLDGTPMGGPHGAKDSKGSQNGAFWRYRYLADTRKGFQRVSGTKPLRYAQPPDTLPELYIPPLIKWADYLKDTAAGIVFTEGELKAAAATKAGIPTLGLGGVWSWKSKKAQLDILPIFEALRLKDRPVTIAFDSDAAANPEVRKAECFFADALGKLGAVVHIARLPPAQDESKQGLDDYLLAHGAQGLIQDVLSVAEPYAQNARLHALNVEVCVVKNPGFVCRLEDRMPMGVADFLNLHYATWQHTDFSGPTPKPVQTAAAWLRWPQRAEVAALTYSPGEGVLTQDGKLNSWPGWSVTPVKGKVDLWLKLLDHLFGYDVVARKWIEQWLAYPLQNPGCKQRNAAVVWGRSKGTGKSLVGYTLGRIYGANFSEIGDDALDSGQAFNAWAKCKQFVLADDITGHSNRRLANKLKTMITRERLEINEKNVKQYVLPDCINYYFTAQDADALYLEDGDRRYFVHEVIAGPLPQAFYTAYDAWYRSAAGIGAVFQYLLDVDCSDYDPMQAPPITASKLHMTAMSKTDLELWVEALLASPDDYLQGLPGDLITTEECLALYDPAGTKREVGAVLMGRKLLAAGIGRTAEGRQVRSKVRGRLVKLYAVRNMAKWARTTDAKLAEEYDANRAQYSRNPAKFAAAKKGKLKCPT